MANNSFSYGFYSDNAEKPSVLAASGPYSSISEAISTILSEYQDITMSGVPPLGHKFGVKENDQYTWYTYKSGQFNLANVGVGIVPEGSGDSITISDSVPTGNNGDTGSSTVALSTKGAYTLAQTIANSNSGVTDVRVNNTSVVTTGVANIPVASDNALGVIQLGYSTSDTNKFALKTLSDSNKAYVEIPQAYLVSVAQKQVIDSLVEVYEDGVFVTDPNMQPVTGSGSGDYSALSDRLDRIEAILGQLMGNNATQDATFIVENTQD